MGLTSTPDIGRRLDELAKGRVGGLLNPPPVAPRVAEVTDDLEVELGVDIPGRCATPERRLGGIPLLRGGLLIDL